MTAMEAVARLGRRSEIGKFDLPRVLRRGAFWIGIYGSALVVFGAFVATRNVDPFEMYRSMWEATVQGNDGPGQVLNRAAPFVLAALAVAVPARAGLINIGGEGQLVIGAAAAAGVGLALAGHGSGVEALILMALAAAAAGAAWAGLAALLKLKGRVDEAISTLLLNFVGIDVVNWLVYGPWKDASGTGQPVSKPLPEEHRLPAISALNANIGIVIAVAVTAVVAIVLWRTRWGFALRCAGGNREAARRAGLSVPLLLASAMLVGGALAGLAGMIQFTGTEGQLRPGIAATFGYTAFLASWLARHEPGKVVLAAFLMASLAVAGDSLQISAGLPGQAVNVLMAVVLLAVLSTRRQVRKAEA
jgi:general nucleoside transport system permease protein